MNIYKITYFILVTVVYLLTTALQAQTPTSKLQKATQQLENDPAMQNAIYSLYVIEDKTGNIVFDKNSQYGLVPASCQKIITCATAFEILGSTYRYTTTISYDGVITDNTLKGNLYITGSGDPSWGSNRYNNTNADTILKSIKYVLEQKNIKTIQGNIILDDACFGTQAIPDGWIWQDIGSYYGAGAWGINWRENEYDIKLTSNGRVGDTVLIDSILLPKSIVTLTSELTVGKEGSGDNAYIYLPPYTTNGYVRGTIPPNKKTFTIHGAMPYPTTIFLNELQQYLQTNGINCTGQWISTLSTKNKLGLPKNVLLELKSPTLDSLAYWFMQKSLNLYGEALLKTIGLQQVQKITTESSAEWVKQFWNKKLGLPNSSLQIVDGSGLSPQNRVTTKALVTILQYAKTQAWFNAFYNALPTINGIKMKSGTIYHAKAYSGYITSKNGQSYTFSFIINNFSGKSSYIMERMFKVLDVLK